MDAAIQKNYEQVKQDVREIVLREKARLLLNESHNS